MSDEVEPADVDPADDGEAIDAEYVAPPPPAGQIIESQKVAPSGRQIANYEPRAVEPVGLGSGSTAMASASAAVAQVRLQIQMAQEFPRNEDLVRTQVHRSCGRYEFAQKALYSYRRGGGVVSGPSVVLAEEIGRLWGNLTWGFEIVGETEETRTVRCWAWDLQANSKRQCEMMFDKVVQRKKGNQTEWVKCDERDLLELTNRNASKGVRNMILGLIPDYLKRDAISWANQTNAKGAAEALKDDPEKFRQGMTLAMAQVGITPVDIELLLGRPLQQVTKVEEMTYLRGVYQRLKSGENSWTEVLAERARSEGVEGPPPATARELRDRVKMKAEAASLPPKKRGDK